jgi:hypothetical protein
MRENYVGALKIRLHFEDGAGVFNGAIILPRKVQNRVLVGSNDQR